MILFDEIVSSGEETEIMSDYVTTAYGEALFGLMKKKNIEKRDGLKLYLEE